MSRIAAGLAALMLLAGCGGEPLPDPWAFGVDPAPRVDLMEDHSDMLLFWLRRGHEARRVVHVDTHDDGRVSDAALVEELGELADDGQWEELKQRSGVAFGDETDKLFNIGNFLHAGWRLGVVREVVWVLPGRAGDLADIERVRGWLRVIGFDEASAASFELKDGLPHGVRGGMPMVLCTADDLPRSDEPSLVSLDIDYFMGVYRGAVETPLPDLVDELFGHLRDAGVRTDDVGISYSVHGDSIPIDLHYAGDYLRQLCLEPGLSAEHPSSWTARAEALAKLEQGELEAASNSLRSLLEAAGDDAQRASLLYDLSGVQLREQGGLEPALASLREATDLAPIYFLGHFERARQAQLGGATGLVEAVLGQATRTYPVQHENGDHATLGASLFLGGDFRRGQVEAFKIVEEAGDVELIAGFRP